MSVAESMVSIFDGLVDGDLVELRGQRTVLYEDHRALKAEFARMNTMDPDLRLEHQREFDAFRQEYFRKAMKFVNLVRESYAAGRMTDTHFASSVEYIDEMIRPRWAETRFFGKTFPPVDIPSHDDIVSLHPFLSSPLSLFTPFSLHSFLSSLLSLFTLPLLTPSSPHSFFSSLLPLLTPSSPHSFTPSLLLLFTPFSRHSFLSSLLPPFLHSFLPFFTPSSLFSLLPPFLHSFLPFFTPSSLSSLLPLFTPPSLHSFFSSHLYCFALVITTAWQSLSRIR